MTRAIPPPLSIRAGRSVVGGEERRGWWITIQDGLIVAAGPSRPGAGRAVDLGPVDLIPGLVDLHSDCLEVKARPRASMELPLDAALVDLDAEVTVNGITTHFICICLEDNVTKYRSIDRGLETAEVIGRLHDQLRADHRIHVRVDVTGDGLDAAAELARLPLVGVLSYMLHLPGHGQFPDEQSWRLYYTSVEGDPTAARDRLALRMTRLDRIGSGRERVAELARGGRAVLASHDDDGEHAIEAASRLGAAIAEFPVNGAAAAAAIGRGMGVLMGAPNARRGSSQHQNLSARDALAAGHLSALASDYHPPSLLGAAYALSTEGLCSWADGIALVTEGPARLAGLADRGVIEPGRRADLVAVGERGGMPAIAQVWAGGKEVFRP